MNQVLVVDTLLECMAFPDPERTSLHLSYRILVPLPDSFVSATEFRSATEFFLAAITIPFWFAFTEALRFVPDVHQKQTLLRNFAPSLTNLSRICMHTMCFRDGFRELPSDKQQDSAKAGHPPMDETPLHTIFAFLPRFPAHPAIQYTSCLVISRYAEWLAGSGAAYLASLLTFVDATVTMSATRHDYHDWYGRLF
ncbi:hypothetical protein DYB34_011667 [Aphanomyces astaci]|uniref:Uncharacterized protein n=1 Tax=Aphanomyces astaci TaxID=112090 RepID=A0A418BBQ1_APHAT|nr:hypothetical protein DYB34_011667 [Aphanomyces astaci]